MGAVEEQMIKLRDTFFALAAWLPFLIALLFFAVPLLMWILSLHPLSTKYGYVLAIYFALVGRTLLISAASALLALLGGSATACIAVFSSRKTMSFLTLMMTVPLLMGFVARNYAWVGLLSQFAGNTHWILVATISRALLYRWLGVVLVMGTVFIPFCYFITLQGFALLSHDMLEAARTLGATGPTIFWNVILPNIRRALFIAYSLSLILAVGYFITPALIGGGNFEFMGNGVLRLLNDLGFTAEASLLALLLLLTVLLPLITVAWWVFIAKKRKEKAALTGVIESSLGRVASRAN